MPESEEPPVVVVIGGPNGAGKTTSAQVLIPKGIGLRQFVNADTIAAGLSAFDPASVALEAGRIMLKRLDELAAQRASFAFETTLASRTFASFLRRLQADGYLAHVYYLWLPRPELSIHRVTERVRRGGHHVPPDVVRRRYWRGLANFFALYQPLADSWILSDNSGSEPRVIARGGREQDTVYLDRSRYDEIQRALAEQRDVADES
jgi:predicted ABC-type ATPase